MVDSTIRVATDVGGTFTDLVCFEIAGKTGQSRVSTAKSATTPPDYETGMMNVIEKAVVDLTKVNFLAHGTTVVINALTNSGHQCPDGKKGRQSWPDHYRRVS